MFYLFMTVFLSSGICEAQKNELPMLFPEELETELALSSLPKHLRSDASIYIYKRGEGLVLFKKGTNGFTALVERVPGFPTAFAPVSFDREGTRTHIPRIIDQSRWIEQGKSPKEIKEAVAMKFLNNEYGIPRSIGISYMLSPTNILPSPTGQPALYYPHYMLYAPYADRSEFGIAKFDWHGIQPIVLDPGPHGLLVIRLGDSETNKIREDESALVEKVEKFIGKKISSLEIAKSHNH